MAGTQATCQDIRARVAKSKRRRCCRPTAICDGPFMLTGQAARSRVACSKTITAEYHCRRVRDKMAGRVRRTVAGTHGNCQDAARARKIISVTALPDGAFRVRRSCVGGSSMSCLYGFTVGNHVLNLQVAEFYGVAARNGQRVNGVAGHWKLSRERIRPSDDKVWDVAEGRFRRSYGSLGCNASILPDGRVLCVMFLPRISHLGCYNATHYLWDVKQIVPPREGIRAGSSCVAAGRRVVSASRQDRERFIKCTAR